MLRALRYRNYRLFFSGQGLSLIGTWLTTTATSWLVYRLASGSVVYKAATMLGVVRFAGQIPMFLFAPFAGVMVDRWNRHRVIVATQFLSMLQSAALAVLALGHWITIPQVIALNVFQGLVNAFDAPARQAFVVDLVERREDLSNAIALNSSMFHGARLIGPAVAGIIIAALSEGVCFAIDAVSYLAVIIALLMMIVPRTKALSTHEHPLRQLHSGIKYTFGFAPVRSVLLLAAFMSLTVSAFQTLIPIFATDLAPKAHGAAIFGFLSAAGGLGALGGAIYLASRRSVVGLGRIIAMAGVLLGAAMIAFAITHMLWLAILMAIIGGCGMTITFAASNTILQALVEDSMRGRLMSFFIMAVMGTAPMGSLIAGITAIRIGEVRTIVFAGIFSVLAALLFMVKLPALRKEVRPIYVKKGILPEVAVGLQQENRIVNQPEQ